MLADPLLLVGLVGLASLEDIGSAGLVSDSSLLSGLDEGVLVFLVSLLLLLQRLGLGRGLLGFSLDLGGH